MRFSIILTLIATISLGTGCAREAVKEEQARRIVSFNPDWKFALGDHPEAVNPLFDDSEWRELSLPHDWSIEGMFSEDHPSTPGGGALPGGIAWYRKSFSLPGDLTDKLVFIEFDGVYQESEVWINGHSLGGRPNGYISFRLDLSPYLMQDGSPNLIAVRVDNSNQPNSRWYSGSGIYRDVRLLITKQLHVDQWGIFITTPEVSQELALVSIQTAVKNDGEQDMQLILRSILKDVDGKEISQASREITVGVGETTTVGQQMEVTSPHLWSPEQAYLYTMLTELRLENGELMDQVQTPFGIRYFEFDAEKGFSLNGKSMKIKGVCNHHDLGALGAAAYPRAIERQLELLKDMGCNAIRTSHNPPAPVLLDLCDRMGFLVMDETFDMWKKPKSKYDYHQFWDEWHERDLTDHILRDRNHPSVIIWSIGNEILEQWDDQGEEMANSLASLVRNLDSTRAITSGCNNTTPENSIIRSGALDLVGFNYAHEKYRDVPDNFPGMPFIASETTSALATRGHYDMPSDSIRIWPLAYGKDAPNMNSDNTCSAYDNCHVPWGSTHEAALLEMNRLDFVSGMFVWTGFDYLGEPTPYGWPSRSSYFGILDLAGFPKDAYYLYKSEWTEEGVLHLFPHWNHNPGDTVDLWAYSNAPELELFLNGKSLGLKEKEEGFLHFQWSVPYEPGTLEARGIFEGRELRSVVETAGEAAGIRLVPDRTVLGKGQSDLVFVRVEIVDMPGRVVPDAENLVQFSVSGPGDIVAVDNGLQTSMEPFVSSQRSAFNGLCLAIVKSSGQKGMIELAAHSKGLSAATVKIEVK